MTRNSILSFALMLLAACGGSGATTPSVKSNAGEVLEYRDEIKALGASPSDASKEVPKLLKAMGDPDPEIRWRAEFALGRVEAPRGIKALAEALRDGSPKIRAAAAFVLGPLAEKAKPAVPALLNALGDKETEVRVWAARSLIEIDPAHPDVTAALVKTLRDPNPDVRRVALSFVIRLGPAATGAAHPMADLLQDTEAGIRAKACVAYRRLGTDGKPGIPALISHLADPDAEVRSRAAQALLAIGPEAIAPLVRALKDRDPKLRKPAAEILGGFGSEARTAAPDLLDASKDDDPGVKQAAADALRKLQGDGGEAATRGTTFIEAPDAQVRRSVGLKWAKIGLFVHWGLSSVPARAKPGQVAEAVMQNEKIAAREYEHFALKFGAEKFSAQAWAKLANETGARYLVLTAKDADGFCLWNSKLTEYNSVRLAVAKRDFVGDLAAACDKEGVKFAAAYSLLDWHHPDYEANPAKYVDYVHGQVRELVSGYPLWGVWFDGELDRTRDEWRGGDLVTLIRQAKPAAFVNDRIGRDSRGTATGVDFYTAEPDAPMATLKLQGRPTAWETGQTFGDSAGYCESPDPLKSAERMIVEMAEAASKGANFLIRIHARPDGTIPEALQARMKLIGGWLRKNGDAIYDTERSPFKGNRIPAGRVTQKGTRLYVFLENEIEDGIIALPGLKTKVREAWVLDGKKELKVRDTGIQAPDLIEGSPLTVVAIELEGAPEITR